MTTARQVLERCDALAACSEEPGRITRRYATPALAAACNLVLGWMAEAGLQTRRDAAGNVIGRYAEVDSDAPTLVLGSHLDSVPDAGRYDGPLGVLGGLACVERLAAAGRRLPFAVEVVGFADEEGTRFGTFCLGSAAYTGSFDPSWLARRDADGITLEAAVRAAGGDPEALVASPPPAGPLLGYLELHIEQGPVLETESLPVGVVTAIAGQTPIGVLLEGVAGHAGTVPMGLRRDALAGAAELVLAVESEGTATPGLVATVGRMRVLPGGSNVIPGRVELTIDARHADDAVLAAAVERLRVAATAIARRRGLELSWTARPKAAVTFSPALTGPLERAVERCGIPVRRLTSGAGHDAMVVSRIAPVAMLFVRCMFGISHHPDESVSEPDVAVALDVLTHTIDELEERFPMTTLTITAGEFRFRGRLEHEKAPATCAAFERLLPWTNRIIHVRWSGESCWIPLGDQDFGVGYESPTSHPAPGEVLLYPGGLSETEILFPYGGCCFSSVVGQLAGNHFLTIFEGNESLRPLGVTCLWDGAQEIVFARE